jgi:hypothetical protein
MDEPGKRLPPRLRGLLTLCYRRARERRRADLRAMQDFFDDLDETEHDTAREAAFAAGLGSEAEDG